MKRLFALPLLLLLFACNKSVEQPDGGDSAKPATYYANLFAFNIMSQYYLWEKEVSEGLSSWTYGDDPIEKVASLRYKDANGYLVDRWTELMEDCSSFVSSVTGNGKTFGMEFVLYNMDGHVVPQVTYTYADSPARKAGLERGDLILKLDGAYLTLDDYVEVLTEKIYDNPGTLTLQLGNGSEVKMTAVKMYSDPVHLVKTLDVDGKKIGYLHFTSFTLDACVQLEDAFNRFKQEGIDDLILDLRYNTGGYTTTAAVLGSMIAPPSVVSSAAVFNKSVYNEKMSGVLSDDECFADSFTLRLTGGEKTIKTLAANPDIQHVWVIVTGHSASASEALICGLMPYMDVTLVGSNTYGKFCGGYLITAEDWYDALSENTKDIDCDAGKKNTENWGIYVIASRYADCNGVTRSMPSGIPADIEVLDNPDDGYPLGDPAESMLAAALAAAAGHPLAAPVKSTAGRREVPFPKPGAGALLW